MFPIHWLSNSMIENSEKMLKVALNKHCQRKLVRKNMVTSYVNIERNILNYTLYE